MAQHCFPYSIQAEVRQYESLNAAPGNICAALISAAVKLEIQVIQLLDRPDSLESVLKVLEAVLLTKPPVTGNGLLGKMLFAHLNRTVDILHIKMNTLYKFSFVSGKSFSLLLYVQAANTALLQCFITCVTNYPDTQTGK